MKSIQLKLVSAFILTTLITTAGMYAFMSWSFDRGFLAYLQAQELNKLSPLSQQLSERYQQENNWQFIIQEPMVWRELHRQYLITQFGNNSIDELGPPPFGEPPPHHRGGKPRLPRSAGKQLEIIQRLTLLNAEQQRIIGRKPTNSSAILQAIVSDNETVGYLRLEPSELLADSMDAGFIRSQTRTFGWISIGMLLLALIIALPISQQLVKPILALLAATKKLTTGDYSTRLNNNSADELGQLSRDFDSLAKTLQANEASRKQWISDISHELRTPIAVLKSQTEAMLDGIRPSDKTNLSGLGHNINQLSKLVDDLYQLSLSDQGALTYRKQYLNLLPLLQNRIEDFHNEFEAKGIALTFNHSSTINDQLIADPNRLQQLFDNLLTNSLRYTDAPGKLVVEVQSNDGVIITTLTDSSPSVNSDELPKLFDRLYRTEKSRNRAQGGAGLGLSLCQNIVHAHNGTITASQSSLGGICITVSLPAS